MSTPTTLPTGTLAPKGCHWSVNFDPLLGNVVPKLVCDKPKKHGGSPGAGGSSSSGGSSPGPNTGASSHPWFVQLGIELVAAAVLIMLAGTSPRGANIAAAITATLWVLWLMNHYG